MALSSLVATRHMWLLSTGSMTSPNCNVLKLKHVGFQDLVQNKQYLTNTFVYQLHIEMIILQLY